MFFYISKLSRSVSISSYTGWLVTSFPSDTWLVGWSVYFLRMLFAFFSSLKVNDSVSQNVCLSMQGCKDTKVQGCKSARMQKSKDAKVQGCKSARMQMCKDANVQVCKSARMQKCKDAKVQMQKCKDKYV